jgi:xanthine dehydrogenase accessory factor
MTETAVPTVVRRGVAFAEAVYAGAATVEGLEARLLESPAQVADVLRAGKIPVLIDPEASVVAHLQPAVVIDAIIAKRNLGTRITDAPLVIGLGPGFTAGVDVHAVIETNRGPNLGRVLWSGCAEPNTGVPAFANGHGSERVLRSPATGILTTGIEIGDFVKQGDLLAVVEGQPVTAPFTGRVRGLLRDGSPVFTGMKIGDLDASAEREQCFRITDKALAIAGGVLEAVLTRLNT